MLLVGDITRPLLVLSTTTNICGGAQSNVVNMHFVPELRPEVVRDISKISSSS